MKAISVRQPWASLIVLGYKEYETRSWRTSVRGKIAIHSSSSQHVAKQLCKFKPYSTLLGQHSCNSYEDLVYGHIIGTVFLDEVIECDDGNLLSVLSSQELSLGNFGHGRLAWKLSSPTPIKPFPFKGKLAFFDVSDELFDL